ncbi:MAG: glycosyltransferase [Bacteroidales bacterium]|jgi:glycosyltransferase involved in cell wall biosynthesis
MPRVLRILNRFNLGGPTYNAAYLTKYLEPEFETMLIGGDNDETEENSEYIVRSLGIIPFTIPEMKRSINPYYDIIAYRKIRDIIKRFRPHIVHTHASKAGALGRRAASYMKVPVIIHTFHGHVFDAYFSSIKSSFYVNIERQLAKKSTRIIALSEIQKEELAKKYKICKPEKIEVIPLGFDLDKFQENMDFKRESFRKDYNIAYDEIAIGIIGRIVPIKNHIMFIEALKYILERTDKKIRVFIIGDGTEKTNIELKAKELGISYLEGNYKNEKAIITFTSWIKNIDYAISGMDIIALTSLNEGTPVSLIEAQAANKPIVTTDVGGIKNVVIPNQTAFISPNGDAEKFGENMLKLLDDDNLRAVFGKSGADFVRKKYHYTCLVNNMKNLYLSLLKENADKINQHKK